MAKPDREKVQLNMGTPALLGRITPPEWNFKDC